MLYEPPDPSLIDLSEPDPQLVESELAPFVDGCYVCYVQGVPIVKDFIGQLDTSMHQPCPFPIAVNELPLVLSLFPIVNYLPVPTDQVCELFAEAYSMRAFLSGDRKTALQWRNLRDRCRDERSANQQQPPQQQLDTAY